MSNVDISFSGDEKDLVKAQAKVIKSQDELISKLKKMKAEGTKASKDNTRELERFAKATRKIDEKPAEKYRATMLKLNASVKAGLLTQEQYARAVRRVGIEQRQAFSPASITAFASMANGVMGSMNKILGALRNVRQETDELGRKQRESEGGLGELAQLATSPEDMRRLVNLSKQTFREGGAESLDAAARLVFSLQSAGALSQRELFSQLGSTKLVSDPAEFARAAATLSESMGVAETGGTRALASKAFGASQFSPARAEELLIAAAQSGVFAQQLGLTDEEILAATAVAATGIGTASEGGTAVTSLLKSLVTKGEFKGLSLQESLGKIQASGMDDAELVEFFGRAEAAKAFGLLTSNMGNFQRNLAAIQESERTDEVGRRLGFAEAIPELKAARLARQEEAKAQIAGDDIATKDTLADALQASLVADMRKRGVGGMRRFIKNQIMNLERLTSGDEAFIARFQKFSPDQKEIQEFGQQLGIDQTGRKNQITGQFALPGANFGQRHAEQLQAERAAMAQAEAAARQANAADRLMTAAAAIEQAARGGNRPAPAPRIRPVPNPVEQ